MSKEDTPVAGRNGVAVRAGPHRQDGYRTYEVHQRQRIGESTEKIRPGSLSSDAYRLDPYPLLTTLRENYPCYRDWQANAYWLTRYDDVTSVFTDVANFEQRPKAWYYGLSQPGRDLNDELAVLTAEASCCDERLETVVGGWRCWSSWWGCLTTGSMSSAPYIGAPNEVSPGNPRCSKPDARRWKRSAR